MFQKLASLIRTRTATQTFTLFAGSLVSKAAAFAVLFWLARALDRPDYDLFAMAMTIMWFVFEFTELGVKHSIVRHAAMRLQRGETEKAAGLFRFAAFVKVGVWAAVMLAVAATAGPVNEVFLGGRGTPGQVILAAGAGVGLGVIVLESGVYHSYRAFGRDVAVSILQNLLKIAAFAVLVLFSAVTLKTSIIVFATVPWAAALFGLALMPRGSVGGGRLDPADLSSVARFWPLLALIVLLSAVQNRLGLFLLKLLSAYEGAVADFFLAQQFATAFLFLLVAYQNVMFSRISAVESFAEVLRVQKKSLLPLLAFAAAVLAAAFAVGPAVKLLLPDKYVGAVPAARWLMLALAAGIAGTPPLLCFMYSKRLSFLLLSHLASLALQVGLCFALIPTLGSTGLAVAFALSQVLHFGLLWIFLVLSQGRSRAPSLSV